MVASSPILNKPNMHLSRSLVPACATALIEEEQSLRGIARDDLESKVPTDRLIKDAPCLWNRIERGTVNELR